MYPLNKPFATESSTIADWDQSCHLLCPPFTPPALVFTDNKHVTTTINNNNSLIQRFLGLFKVFPAPGRRLLGESEKGKNALGGCLLPPAREEGVIRARNHFWNTNPSPIPCRVCSRLCVSNKFSHFRQAVLTLGAAVGPVSQRLGPVSPSQRCKCYHATASEGVQR